MIRRKPVPRAWRDLNHDLSQRTRYWSGGAIRGSRTYRSGGICSCGARFGLDAQPQRSNMAAEDVREAYLDHVAQAYHGDDYFVVVE
jgi:hypothetical protein